MSIKRDYDCFLLYFVEEQLVLIAHFPSYSKNKIPSVTKKETEISVLKMEHGKKSVII